MKAFLMYKDHNFELKRRLSAHEQTLIQDLELNTLFDAMARNDEFILDVSSKAVLYGINDVDTILYRQDILKDCLKNSSIVREIYNITVETIASEKKHFLGLFSKYPSYILNRSIEVLEIFVDSLKKLRAITDEHAGKFVSEGFTAFFMMLERELSDEYIKNVREHLADLKLPYGTLISAELGKGNKGINYVLRKQHVVKQNWVKRIFAAKPEVHTFYISDRDEAGASALMELNDMGINLAANALAQSTDHILNFFNTLRIELAFYIGCLNLYEQLEQIGEPVSFPQPEVQNERRHSFRGLYDICLALTKKGKIVGNDLDADGKGLVIITGANQGGKSTFLRSIGLSQLMLQCGMFVPAESLCANTDAGLFTHYKREEDNSMSSGKLDEELKRMSDIADNIKPDSIILFNESFAATNEREGSEIARQIISALAEKRIKIFFVTHLYEFAHGFYQKKPEDAIFLRAERQTDGGRTFKIVEGEPLQTSFGEDLYKIVFEDT